MHSFPILTRDIRGRNNVISKKHSGRQEVKKKMEEETSADETSVTARYDVKLRRKMYVFETRFKCWEKC